MRIFFLCLFWYCNVWASSFAINVTRGEGLATGMAYFVEKDGFALTAWHVVEGADLINARIGFKQVNGEIVGFDEVLDVALLKFDVSVKDYYSLKGDITVEDAVKIAGRLGSVVWIGKNDFMMDLDIVRGISGSVVKCKQEACGLVTSFDKCTGNAIAVKGKKIQQVLPYLKEGGRFKKKDLGIYVMDLTLDVLQRVGVDFKKTQGVLVTKTYDGLFFNTWDIITSVDSVAINGTEGLQRVLSQKYEKEPLKITVIREKKEINFWV